MDPAHIPDDVWSEIFQYLPRQQLAANVQRTCRRFRTLAATPLLRHMLWRTPAQIEAELELWDTVRATRVMFPRSLYITLRLPVDAQTNIWDSIPVPMLTSKNAHSLYRNIHVQLPRFTSLHTLIISNMALSEDTCRALQLIPTLRSLRILNTFFHVMNLNHAEYRQRMNLPPIQLSTLPITHLALHNVHFDSEPYSACHPMRILIAPTLTALAITWDGSTGLGYQLLVHDPLSLNQMWRQVHRVPAGTAPFATHAHPRASANLREIEVRFPCLDDSFFEGFVGLLSPPPAAAAALLPPPRVKVHVGKTKLKPTEFALERAREPLARPPGVWSYTGPFHALDTFVPSRRLASDTPPFMAEDDADTLDSDDLGTPLEQLRLRPPGVPVSHVVYRLQRLVWPLALAHLEVCVHAWDVEILYAIRELCPNVARVVVRYGEGTMDEDHLITLGSPIFAALKHLHTLRILHDPRCAKDAVPPRPRTFFDGPLFGEDPVDPDPLLPPRSRDIPQPPAQRQRQPEATPTEAQAPADTISLADCLAGWQRYCPSLRRVQVSFGGGGSGGSGGGGGGGGGEGARGVGWRRRWGDDTWRKVWVADVEDPEARGDSDYGWGDGSDEVDEGEIWSEIGNGSG